MFFYYHISGGSLEFYRRDIELMSINILKVNILKVSKSLGADSG